MEYIAQHFDNMNINALYLVIFCMSTWRLASLFANEQGPFRMFGHIRNGAKFLVTHTWLFQAFHLDEGLGCEWCNSVWFGTLGATCWFFLGQSFLVFCLPFCASAFAIFFKYVIHNLQASE